MAHARFNDVIVAEVLIDRLGLGGRLDDHEILSGLLAHLVRGLSSLVTTGPH